MLIVTSHGESQLMFISSPFLVTPSTIPSTKTHQLINPRNTKLPNIAKTTDRAPQTSSYQAGSSIAKLWLTQRMTYPIHRKYRVPPEYDEYAGGEGGNKAELIWLMNATKLIPGFLTSGLPVEAFKVKSCVDY